MRVLARWTTRFVLAAATGITIAAFGAGAAHADGSETPDAPPATTAPAPATTERAENFPWG